MLNCTNCNLVSAFAWLFPSLLLFFCYKSYYEQFHVHTSPGLFPWNTFLEWRNCWVKTCWQCVLCTAWVPGEGRSLHFSLGRDEVSLEDPGILACWLTSLVMPCRLFAEATVSLAVSILFVFLSFPFVSLLGFLPNSPLWKDRLINPVLINNLKLHSVTSCLILWELKQQREPPPLP